MSVTPNIFAQYKPIAGETIDLYVAETGTSAFGTLYIAAQQGYDVVSVMLVPEGETVDNKNYIMRNTTLAGNVPIYLQQIYLNEGDTIKITSTTGDCSFTFTGELYS